MEINNVLADLPKLFAKLQSSYCIINGTFLELREVEAMGGLEFGWQAKLHMPQKLYRYYSNEKHQLTDGQLVNYSQDALKTNMVFMSFPEDFDDAFDSEVPLDYSEFERYRLIEYCKCCGIEENEDVATQEIGNRLCRFLCEYYRKYGQLDGAFIKHPASENERLSNQIFLLKVSKQLLYKGFGEVIRDVIYEEYNSCYSELKNTFRTACFATTPYSQLMWASYANCHKGFCIEYTTLPNAKGYEEVYNNLYPMVYSKTRSNITKRIAMAYGQEPDEKYLWDLYFHGALRKSIDWAFQNEWRLLLPYGKTEKGYNIRFFPISKVYLGNRMSVDDRKEIISICKDNGIPYSGVKRNPAQFEMQDCEVLCEDCPQISKKKE